MADFQELQDRIGTWSDAKFGAGREPIGNINHLLKEVGELRDNPYNPEHWADVLILVLNASRQAGYNVDDLIQATEAKFAVIQTWKWNEPDELGVIQHVREESPESVE